VDAIITFAIKINTIMVAINLFLNQTKFFEVDVVFLVFYMLSIMGTVCITALSVSEKFIVYPSDRVWYAELKFATFLLCPVSDVEAINLIFKRLEGKYIKFCFNFLIAYFGN
jgi:hypothetical protein